MPANAALYLPVKVLDLSEVFPEARPVGGLFRRKCAFSVPFKNTHVRFNVMASADVPGHLRQFAAYVDSLEDSASDKEAAKAAIAKTGTVMGLETDLDFEGNEELGELLERIIEHYKGCVFMFDSVVRYGGEVLVGPLKEDAT